MLEHGAKQKSKDDEICEMVVYHPLLHDFYISRVNGLRSHGQLIEDMERYWMLYLKNLEQEVILILMGLITEHLMVSLHYFGLLDVATLKLSKFS